MNKIKAIGLGLALIVLSGCANGADQTATTTTAPPAPKINVVATTTQIGDFVREIAGDEVNLDVIMAPGQIVATHQPTAEDITTLANANVILRSGVGLDSWLEQSVEPTARGLIRDVSTGVRIEQRVIDGALVADPYYWMSPVNSRIAVANIVAALSERDSSRTDLFRTNERAYSAQLDSLRRTTERTLASLVQRKLVTARNDFGYYTREFDLDYVGAVEGAQRDQLINDIRSERVNVVVLSSVGSAAGAFSLAAAAGITVSSNTDVLYGESLGAQGTPQETYVGAMRTNADVLVSSLD